LKKEKAKITKWMKQCRYEPLANNNVKARKITKILDMAYHDLDKLADRYAKLIELVSNRKPHSPDSIRPTDT